MPIHLTRDQLPSGGMSAQFEGFRFDPAIPLAIFFTEAPPGAWIEPHTHPYTEVFAILAGTGTYAVAGETFSVAAGDVVVVLPEEVHEIRNTGDGTLHQLGIHCHGEFQTEWITQ